MTDKTALGRLGEEHTALYLSNLGYKITARNYSCKYGEIDIIAQKDDIIAFVEVKTRKPLYMVSPLQSVSADKQRKIIKTAYRFLYQTHICAQPRFDIAAIVAEKSGDSLIIQDFQYYESAFDAGYLH